MAKVSKRRGKWVLDYYDHQGKRRWKTMPAGSTKAVAEKELRAIQREIRAGTWMLERDVPIFQRVAGDWLEFKRANVRETTWGMYEMLLRLHFADLNNAKIKVITAQKIESFIAAKQAAGMNIGTIRRIMTTLNQVLRYAARHRYIDHNPFTDVEKPRGKGKEKKDKILQILDHEQIAQLLDAVEHQKYKMLVQLSIFTGARQGEALGLKWGDIDFGGLQIHIKRTFNKGRWFDVKTAYSDRRVDIGPVLSRALKEWRLVCPASDLNLVFPNDKGKPINAANLVNRYFKPVLKAAGLPDMRWHDIRHSFASLLIAQGEDPKYIQAQMGHSSIQMTFDIYGHLLGKKNRESARKMEQAVFTKG